MFPYAASRRGRVDNDEERRDRRSWPAPLGGDPAGEPRLAVERDEHRLQIREDGLHLDDEERAALPVARKDIDRAALAVDRKRDLGQDVPSRALQDSDHALDGCGMAGVEQPVEVLALPREPDVEPCTE